MMSSSIFQNSLTKSFHKVINDADILNIFKLKLMKESYKDQVHEETFQSFNEALKSRNCPLFARSSNWNKGIFTDNESHISAKYIIGMPYNMTGIYFYEIREYIVTYDISN